MRKPHGIAAAVRKHLTRNGMHGEACRPGGPGRWVLGLQYERPQPETEDSLWMWAHLEWHDDAPGPVRTRLTISIDGPCGRGGRIHRRAARLEVLEQLAARMAEGDVRVGACTREGRSFRDLFTRHGGIRAVLAGAVRAEAARLRRPCAQERQAWEAERANWRRRPETAG